ncbi:MAG: nickel-dependent hydrogenase large subunit [Deltaproteobacteria bacterium]|jgi:[NiFe] hydrogenase large subunit|nr:nickel-dependent hydrogenase large subunit [Deltaproteobacteria bacterium]
MAATATASVPVTPQGDYTGRVIVDPVTRIEGHLRINVEVENGKVKEARSTATLFRGIEIILKGRDPRDAQHFTQRTCGVCTYTHALASTRAVDMAVGVSIPKNATRIRNLVLAAQFLHDHIVHFYGLHALDFVDITSALKADPAQAAKLASNISPRRTKAGDLKAVQDKLKAFVGSGQLGPFANAYFLGGHPAYYLSPELNLIATAHYLEALRVQARVARAMAVFGGKNPHPQFLLVGGVSSYTALTKESIAEFRGLIREGVDFVNQVYIPDLLAIAAEYKDWTKYGGCSNFMTFGEFPTDEKNLNSRYFKPGVVFQRKLSDIKPFLPEEIKEHVRHSWFKGETARQPNAGETDPQFTQAEDLDRYSWSKAPRYQDEPMETGPLAQMLISYMQGHAEVKKTVDMVLKKLGMGVDDLFSTLGRTAARGIQAAVIAGQVGKWIDEFEAGAKDSTLVTPWEMPQEGSGVGFVTAPRGGLSHWIEIRGGVIDNFQLVVPSTWNLGPRCANDKPGPLEEALLGHPIADHNRPVELLRTVHSFDPCMACAVHIIDPQSNEEKVFRVL